MNTPSESTLSEDSKITFERGIQSPQNRKYNMTSSETQNAPEAPSSSQSSSTLTPAPEWKPSKRFYVILLTLCIITLAIALDATSLSVALPIMSEKLHGTAIEAFWSGTSFLLTSTVFQPNFASLSDIFGRKPLILAGLVFFTAGAIIAGVANNFGVILVGRSIQGVGGGAIMALTEIIITDLVPLRERGKYFGFQSMMWAIGSVSGPIVGGAFAQEASWRWIFWLNLPFCVIGFVTIPLFMNLNHKTESFVDKLKMIDWVGSFLFVGSVTAVLIPITWGGVMYDWDSWRTLVPLLVGIAGLVVFVVYEKWFVKNPLIRLNLFDNRTAIANYFGTVMHGIVLWCLLYYLPLYYEAIKGFSPIMTGVALFPQTFTVAPASVAVGILVSVTGRFRWALWSGWTLTLIGMGLLTILGVHTTTVGWVFICLVGGLGTGILFPSMAFALQAAASDADTAYAVSLFSFFRSFGQAFGVAIGGVIFQNALTSKLSAIPGLSELAGEYAKDSVAMVQLIKAMPLGTPGRDELLSSYAGALRVVWMSMIGFSAAGLLASLWTEGLSLDRQLNSEHGLREKKVKDVEKAKETN